MNLAITTDEDGPGKGEIVFPITVNKIKFDGGDAYRGKRLFGGKCGDFVSVRPCAERHGKKTFLGILIGEVAVSMGVVFDKKDGTLGVQRYGHNPMIFIPDLNEVVFGYESWWGPIRNADELRQITDEDIQNVWYVKALKALTSSETVSGGRDG
jgi:hypothetical protein